MSSTWMKSLTDSPLLFISTIFLFFFKSTSFEIIEKPSFDPYKLKTLQISTKILFLLQKFFIKFSADILKDDKTYSSSKRNQWVLVDEEKIISLIGFRIDQRAIANKAPCLKVVFE